MKRRLFTALILACLCMTTASAIENPFTDVSSDSALAQPVLWALEEGITAGTSDTTFTPTDTCTRGQVVTFLWRASGEPTPTSNENPFTDVAADDYFYEAVLWAVEEGITAGTSTTTFTPNDTCTSGQVLTFLYRANGKPDATGEGEYYDDAINWATANGIASDVSPSSQSPRSDIVTYLYRNAGSPQITITQPEVVTYRYTMPQVETPGTATLTTEYFDQVILYMMVNDLISYDCYFPGVSSGYDLEDQGLKTLVSQSCFYIKDKYMDLGGFYAGYDISWSSDGNNTTVTISLPGEGLTDQEVITYKAAFIEDIEDLVTDFFETGEIHESDSDYTKALYFYRWCALNLSYDTTLQFSSYYGYGTLANRTGVCQGYVSIFNAMCNVAGIEAHGVSGNTSGGGHVWSYVNLDGSWLYVDPTFGDPIPNRVGYCDETYFAVTKEFLSSTHTFDPRFD